MKISGSIQGIRKLEDCIRGSGLHYLEYVRSRDEEHPVQGEAFPSKAFTKHYEVKLDVHTNIDMPIGEFVFSLGPVADIKFYYDYKSNQAVLTMGDMECKYLVSQVAGLNPLINEVNRNYFRGRGASRASYEV